MLFDMWLITETMVTISCLEKQAYYFSFSTKIAK